MGVGGNTLEHYIAVCLTLNSFLAAHYEKSTVFPLSVYSLWLVRQTRFATFPISTSAAFQPFLACNIFNMLQHGVPSRL